MRLGTAGLIVGAIVVIAFGVVIPLFLAIYTMQGLLTTWFSVPVAIVSLIVAGVLGFLVVSAVFIVASEASEKNIEKYASEELFEEKLRAYRARQRAMLEELDEIKEVLDEIKEVLRRGGLGEE